MGRHRYARSRTALELLEGIFFIDEEVVDALAPQGLPPQEVHSRQ